MTEEGEEQTCFDLEFAFTKYERESNKKKGNCEGTEKLRKRKQQERPGGHWDNMEKNDWQDQKNNNGSDFMKVVQDAINSGDYQQLNEQVRKTVVVPYRKCAIWVETAKWYYGGDATGRKRTAGRSERGHEQCTAGVERVSKYRLEKNRSDIPYELPAKIIHRHIRRAPGSRHSRGNSCRPSMHRIRREKSQERFLPSQDTL